MMVPYYLSNERIKCCIKTLLPYVVQIALKVEEAIKWTMMMQG